MKAHTTKTLYPTKVEEYYYHSDSLEIRYPTDSNSCIRLEHWNSDLLWLNWKTYIQNLLFLWNWKKYEQKNTKKSFSYHINLHISRASEISGERMRVSECLARGECRWHGIRISVSVSWWVWVVFMLEKLLWGSMLAGWRLHWNGGWCQWWLLGRQFHCGVFSETLMPQKGWMDRH